MVDNNDNADSKMAADSGDDKPPPPAQSVMDKNKNNNEKIVASSDDAAGAASAKLNPFCLDPQMIAESMAASELQAVAFPPTFSLTGSSTLMADAANTSESLNQLQAKSEQMSSQVVSRTQSRHGRSTQRWGMYSSNGDTPTMNGGSNTSSNGDSMVAAAENSDSKQALSDETTKSSSQRVRLVTGTVPLLADGRVLLVSSGKKVEWILPKGGWEDDESEEESAVRETYEEAGVSGILGPALRPVYYETRKARRRRLDHKPSAAESNGDATPRLPKIAPAPSTDKNGTTLARGGAASSCSSSSSLVEICATSPAHHHISPDPQQQQRQQKEERTQLNISPVSFDDACHQQPPPSSASTSSSVTAENNITPATGGTSYDKHTHARMRMFPLYVQHVGADWPESGRLRKALTIDAAMKVVRPEFQEMLLEIQQRGLNLAAGG